MSYPDYRLGAAGLSAAVNLHRPESPISQLPKASIRNFINTGSDKQTYYNPMCATLLTPRRADTLAGGSMMVTCSSRSRQLRPCLH